MTNVGIVCIILIVLGLPLGLLVNVLAPFVVAFIFILILISLPPDKVPNPTGTEWWDWLKSKLK